MVFSTKPLLIAAYTDELDCVAMLSFPNKFVYQYRLSIRMRLLTVNYYRNTSHYDPDLIPGTKMIQRRTGFHPMFTDFLTNDNDRVESRKKDISEDEWQRANKMGMEYL